MDHEFVSEKVSIENPRRNEWFIEEIYTHIDGGT